MTLRIGGTKDDSNQRAKMAHGQMLSHLDNAPGLLPLLLSSVQSAEIERSWGRPDAYR